MTITQGWINLYKPKYISSFQVLNKIKKKFNFLKLGHAGTLDPMAEGVLPIAIGKTTKLIQYIAGDLKKYKFVVEWGTQTSTDDKMAMVLKKSKIVPTIEDIINSLSEFEGTISQYPPKVSAVKIRGERAYKLFRYRIETLSKSICKKFNL